MNDKIIIKLISIVTIIIMIVIVGIIILIKKNGNNENNEYNDEISNTVNLSSEKEDVEEVQQEEFTEVNNLNEIYTVERYIQKYVNNLICTITQMSEKQMSDNYKILKVKALIIDNSLGTYKYRYFLIKINYEDNSYSIIELDNGEIDNSINLDNDVKLNGDNNFEIMSLSDAEMSDFYYENFKNIFLYDDKLLFEKLDENYKKIKFNAYEEYESYAKRIKKKINKSILIKFKRTSNDDGSEEYRLLNDYDNCFIVQVDADNVLNYKIMLDDYTLKNESFSNLYNNASDIEKVKANIQIFIKMLNNKDYIAVYNVLDENFRKNNFDTVEKFANYAKANFFENIIIDGISDISKTSTYYTCKLQILSDYSSASQRKEQAFVVALGDGLDFKLSFTIKK